MLKFKKIKIKTNNDDDGINKQKTIEGTYKSWITRKTSVRIFTSKYLRGNM